MPDGTFATSHSGIVNIEPVSLAIVIHEDDERVFGDPPFIKLSHEFADVFVDVFDHAVEAGLFGAKAEIGEAFGVLFGSDEGAVGCVGGDVGEEGFFFVGLGFDPAEGGGEVMGVGRLNWLHAHRKLGEPARVKLAWQVGLAGFRL